MFFPVDSSSSSSDTRCSRISREFHRNVGYTIPWQNLTYSRQTSSKPSICIMFVSCYCHWQQPIATNSIKHSPADLQEIISIVCHVAAWIWHGINRSFIVRAVHWVMATRMFSSARWHYYQDPVVIVTIFIHHNHYSCGQHGYLNLSHPSRRSSKYCYTQEV